MTRAEMPVFLIGALGETPVEPPSGIFSDVPIDSFFAGCIERLAEPDLGITASCEAVPKRYCPDEKVTRGQMAVFLIRALRLTEQDPFLGTFTDVPESNFFAGFIERLALLGITSGCSNDPVLQYCPDNPVTRAEMAVFIVRAFELLVVP